VKVNGKLRYPWRALDHEGEVFRGSRDRETRQGCGAEASQADHEEIRPTAERRHRRARAYSTATKEIGAADWHEVGGRLNNRAENSHQPFWRRKRAMQRFRGMKTLQKFSSVHAQLHNHFNQERHLVTRETYKQKRSAALAEWRTLAA